MGYKIKIVACRDGVHRFLRQHVRRKSAPKKDVSKDVDPIFLKFDDLYASMSEEYLGERRHFYKKKWSYRKNFYITKIIEMVNDHSVPDLELFLKAQFDASRSDEKALWSNVMASKQALQTYDKWLNGYQTVTEAKADLETRSLEDIIRINHKRFCWYKNLGLNTETILITKNSEFDPIYLVTIPEFTRLVDLNPKAFKDKRKEIDHTLWLLNQDTRSKLEFLELARGIKCQVTK